MFWTFFSYLIVSPLIWTIACQTRLICVLVYITDAEPFDYPSAGLLVWHFWTDIIGAFVYPGTRSTIYDFLSHLGCFRCYPEHKQPLSPFQVPIIPLCRLLDNHNITISTMRLPAQSTTSPLYLTHDERSLSMSALDISTPSRCISLGAFCGAGAVYWACSVKGGRGMAG